MMSKEQELLQMCKYLAREKPYNITVESEDRIKINGFVTIYNNAYKSGYSARFVVDFTNNICVVPAGETIMNTEHQANWDHFVERAHDNLTRWVTSVVEKKIEAEEARRAKCRLDSRIARELRSVQ